MNDPTPTDVAATGGGVSTIHRHPAVELALERLRPRTGRYTPDALFGLWPRRILCLHGRGKRQLCHLERKLQLHRLLRNLQRPRPAWPGHRSLPFHEFGAAQGNLNPGIYATLRHTLQQPFTMSPLPAAASADAALTQPAYAKHHPCRSRGNSGAGFQVGAGYNEELASAHSTSYTSSHTLQT